MGCIKVLYHDIVLALFSTLSGLFHDLILAPQKCLGPTHLTNEFKDEFQTMFETTLPFY